MPSGNTSPEHAEIAARRAKLVDYRRKRVPFRAFYQTLGYSSESAARKDFTRALEEVIAAEHASVEIYRQEQLNELDYLAYIAHGVLTARHYVIAPGGKIVRDPDTDEPLIDDGPILAAIDRLVKILERVSKLRGLDSATKIEGAITVEALDRALTEAREQLAALGAETPEDAGAETAPG